MSAPFAGLVLALCVYACVPSCAADTNYSQPLLNESYVSNPRFVARGLAPLYDGVSVFLRGIQKHDILPEGLLHVKNGSIEVNTNLDYGSVALFYIGILVLLCIGLAVVLIAPFIGLIWCCSCCTSNKRRRHRRLEDDERGHREKQERRPRGPVCAPMILAAITGVIVAGVAIALAANAYIDDGIVGLGHHVASGTADIRLYVDNAHTEVDTILDINYNELSSGLHSVLEGSRTETNNLVDEFIKFLPLDTIDSMATGIETIQTDLVDISSTIQTCMDTSDDIVQEIEFIRKTLDQVCANLGSSCPTELSSFNQNLSPPNFQQLPKAEIEKSMQDLTTIIPKEFKENLKRGREEVDSLGTRTQQIFNDVSTQMNVTILQTGENLKQKGSEFVQAATNATDSLVNVDNKVSDFQDYYKQSYQFYRVIAFTAYIAVVLVIAALITIGLVCGGCSSKHSYTFLNVPVFLILLTISVWMLIVMALFVTGVATDRACEFLRQPGDHQLSYLVDEMLQHYRDGVAEGSQLPPLHNISYYISECRMDKTMYEVIDLESTIQIDNIFNYIDEFDFNSYLKDVDEALDKVVNVKIIPKNVIDQIVELKNSEVSQLDLTKLLKELDEFENTVGQLIGAGWEQQLEKIASQYTTISVNQQVTDLKQVAEKAEKLQQSAKLLAEILERFSDDIKLGHESFPFALQWLLDQASQTDQMVTDTAPRIRKIAEDTANGFKTEVAAYLNRSVERVKLHALRCKPIINIYDTMVMGVCDEIIAPWNAFWAMSGFCLLLLIPAAFFSNYLSSY